MKRQEKQETLKAPAIGYYSGLGGLAIKRIEYGVDDFAVFTAGEFTGRKTAHKACITLSRETILRILKTEEFSND